jgi:hypothetical protein
VRVLLSEASSLTAREHLSVLGPTGIDVDALSSVSLPLSRFSRWSSQIIRVPAIPEDPLGYLEAIGRLLTSGRYDALLPTHEQAWLLAAGRHLLPSDVPLAVSPIEAFDLVQSKVDFCRLLDEMGLPQPAWSLVTGPDHVAAVGFPCWMKAEFSTAGRGVRHVESRESAARAFAELCAPDVRVLVQQPAEGSYAQVAALFSHGQLVAVHCSEQVGVGAGGSAAARIGVDHPLVREHVTRLGAFLGWHGGLTMDYLHLNGEPAYIECNPRTVEPANAAASGVDLPQLTVAISRGDSLPDVPVVGRAGQRTHSAMALMLGDAENGSRLSSLKTVLTALTGRGTYRGSREVLTPLRTDWQSAVPLAVTALRVLARPTSVGAIAAEAVRGYSVPASAVDQARSATTT